jgi:hypothetical protein
MAGALQLEVIAAREMARPALGKPLRRLGVVAEQGLADIAARRARERDQSFGRAFFLKPRTRNLAPAPMLVAQPGAREQVAQALIAGARRAKKQDAERLVSIGLVL